MDVGSHGNQTPSPFTLGAFIVNQKYNNDKARNTSLHVTPNRYSRTNCRLECALKKALLTLPRVDIPEEPISVLRDPEEIALALGPSQFLQTGMLSSSV